MKDYDSIQGENLEEADMAQLLSVTLNDDAVARVRSQIPTGPSQSHCNECGEEIPKERQLAVKGCTMCIECQKFNERFGR